MVYNKMISEYAGKEYVIEEDLPEIGVYLYIYDNGRCIYDYLQNSIEICKKIAYEKYGVPLDSWISVKN